MQRSPGQPRLTLKSFGVAMMLSAAGVPAANAALNSAQIVASAVSQSCISWRVSGICYWLFCSWGGCTVRTSVKVTHFIPEAVVSAYNAQGGNPWREMSMVSQAAGGLESSITSALGGVAAGGGNNELKTPGQRKTNLHFKYADAIGHPATTLIGGSIAGYSCRSAATPSCRISSARWTAWHGVLACRNPFIPKHWYLVSVRSAVRRPRICGAMSIPVRDL